MCTQPSGRFGSNCFEEWVFFGRCWLDFGFGVLLCTLCVEVMLFRLTELQNDGATFGEMGYGVVNRGGMFVDFVFFLRQLNWVATSFSLMKLLITFRFLWGVGGVHDLSYIFLNTPLFEIKFCICIMCYWNPYKQLYRVFDKFKENSWVIFTNY